MKTIYVFEPTVDHLDNKNPFDASLVNFPGADSITSYISSGTMELEGKIFRFTSSFDSLTGRDFLYTNVSWPVFSQKLYNVIAGLKVAHRKFPVSIELKNKNIVEDEYVAVQILPKKGLVDKKKSDYEEDTILEGEILFFRRVELTEPAGGFDPVFRIDEDSVKLLITEEAKREIEQSRINGIRIIPINKYNWETGM